MTVRDGPPGGCLLRVESKKRGIFMRVLLFLALIYPAMASAATAWESGNDLLSKCEQEGDFFEGVCVGYILGIMDGHDALIVWGELNEPTFCRPDGLSVRQVQAVVIKYLKEHPEDLHKVASSLVLTALTEAFTPEVKFENGEPVLYCP